MSRPAIGFKPIASDARRLILTPKPHNQIIYARWDGQPKRPPKKGEYFISGAYPHAYLAKTDLHTHYFIAVLIKE